MVDNEERIEKQEEDHVNFLLHDIPKELHVSIKVKAAQEGMTMNEWIMEACRKHLS